jgi:hypothetical protein
MAHVDASDIEACAAVYRRIRADVEAGIVHLVKLQDEATHPRRTRMHRALSALRSSLVQSIDDVLHI